MNIKPLENHMNVILSVAIGFVIIIAGVAKATAGPADAGSPGHQHNHEGQTWPPQPVGITNVVLFSDPVKESRDKIAKKSRLDFLEGIARADPIAKLQLGNKSTRITEIIKSDKKTGKSVSQVVFFSRDKNKTVEIDYQNNKVQAINSRPAWDYQPEITDEEITEAAELARTYFLNLGRARVLLLKAYGILAYRPEGNGFFDTRVIYVSFHEDNDSPPQLMAWVDLTNQLVINAREEP